MTRLFRELFEAIFGNLELLIPVALAGVIAYALSLVFNTLIASAVALAVFLVSFAAARSIKHSVMLRHSGLPYESRNCDGGDADRMAILNAIPPGAARNVAQISGAALVPVGETKRLLADLLDLGFVAEIEIPGKGIEYKKAAK